MRRKVLNFKVYSTTKQPVDLKEEVPHNNLSFLIKFTFRGEALK